MATQGIVSILENGQVILKVISGCDGYGAANLAAAIKAKGLRDLEAVYDEARKHLGCEACLVVMNAERIYYPGGDEDLPLYRKTFNDLRFNPRWESGLVEDDCLAIVEM